VPVLQSMQLRFRLVAGFLPPCDALHVALLIKFTDVYCACTCDHKELKELNYESLANIHFTHKLIKKVLLQ